jgi:hypothetical protein
MNLDINEQELNLLLELIGSAEEAEIQSKDHATSRVFKNVLRNRLALLESLKEKICISRTWTA